MAEEANVDEEINCPSAQVSDDYNGSIVMTNKDASNGEKNSLEDTNKPPFLDQAIEDLEVPPKWEMTTLEKASYDCNETHIDTLAKQQQQEQQNPEDTPENKNTHPEELQQQQIEEILECSQDNTADTVPISVSDNQKNSLNDLQVAKEQHEDEQEQRHDDAVVGPNQEPQNQDLKDPELGTHENLEKNQVTETEPVDQETTPKPVVCNDQDSKVEHLESSQSNTDLPYNDQAPDNVDEEPSQGERELQETSSSNTIDSKGEKVTEESIPESAHDECESSGSEGHKGSSSRDSKTPEDFISIEEHNSDRNRPNVEPVDELVSGNRENTVIDDDDEKISKPEHIEDGKDSCDSPDKEDAQDNNNKEIETERFVTEDSDLYKEEDQIPVSDLKADGLVVIEHADEGEVVVEKPEEHSIEAPVVEEPRASRSRSRVQEDANQTEKNEPQIEGHKHDEDDDKVVSKGSKRKSPPPKSSSIERPKRLKTSSKDITKVVLPTKPTPKREPIKITIQMKPRASAPPTVKVEAQRKPHDNSFDHINKKYRCEKCQYGTDRLNNIVYHKKNSCAYTQQQYADQVAMWKLKMQSPKSNTTRKSR